METTPHGEGDVTDQVNSNYDPDEDNLIENIDSETVQDIVAAFMQGTNGASVSYDDANDTLTIDASNAGKSTEEIQDIAAGLITGGSNVSVSYDDANDTLTIDAATTVDESANYNWTGEHDFSASPINFDANGVPSASGMAANAGTVSHGATGSLLQETAPFLGIAILTCDHASVPTIYLLEGSMGPSILQGSPDPVWGTGQGDSEVNVYHDGTEWVIENNIATSGTTLNFQAMFYGLGGTL